MAAQGSPTKNIIRWPYMQLNIEQTSKSMSMHKTANIQGGSIRVSCCTVIDISMARQ